MKVLRIYDSRTVGNTFPLKVLVKKRGTDSRCVNVRIISTWNSYIGKGWSDTFRPFEWADSHRTPGKVRDTSLRRKETTSLLPSSRDHYSRCRL